MTIRIDYLNKDGEVRHIFVILQDASSGCINAGDIGYIIEDIIKQGATNIRIYDLTKDLWWNQ